MKSKTVRAAVIVVLLACVAYAAFVLSGGRANAAPDPYWPVPPVWCPGGGTSTGWGGYCNGAVFPDGTQWHQDSFVAPFVGRVYNPIVCVVANTPAPPPLAPAGGCGGQVR